MRVCCLLLHMLQNTALIDAPNILRSMGCYVSGTYNTCVNQHESQPCNNDYSNCSSMTTLSYYNETASKEPKTFIDFCDKYYAKQYLQDYIHVITVHKNDINAMFQQEISTLF